MKRHLLMGLGGWLAAAAQAYGQPAEPQVRSPWADSTHIRGVAQKVMPDAPTSPPVVPVPDAGKAPATIQDFLDALNGADIYFREAWDGRSGWAELPAFLRVAVRSSGAQIQVHNPGQNAWYELCTLTPWKTQCVLSAGTPVNLTFGISNSAITIAGAGCGPGYYGSAQASGSYTWEAFAHNQSAFSNQNRHLEPVANGYSGHFFMNGSFLSACSYEFPG